MNELVAAPSYAATEASLHFELRASELGLRLMVWGLHERLPRLFALLLDQFAVLAASPTLATSSSSPVSASSSAGVGAGKSCEQHSSAATRATDAELRDIFKKHLENRLRTYFNTALRPQSLEQYKNLIRNYTFKICVLKFGCLF